MLVVYIPITTSANNRTTNAVSLIKIHLANVVANSLGTPRRTHPIFGQENFDKRPLPLRPLSTLSHHNF